MPSPRREAALAALRAALEAGVATEDAGAAWAEAGDVLAATLTEGERYMLAAILGASAGLPAVPLDKADRRAQAQLWTAAATGDDLRVYGWAIWQAMAPGMRRAYAKAIRESQSEQSADVVPLPRREGR